jgi:hypothetical protein
VCRNIRKLRQPDQLPTEQEVKDAALQFVRKVSGYRKPSRVNERPFNDAVNDIAAVTRRLFEDLETRQELDWPYQEEVREPVSR